MSLSKPFRFENNRVQNPWIASTITGKETSKSKPQTVKVLKHVCGPLDDGSMIREVTDGELFITTVFSKESILKFYTQLDECTPPEWTNALLILKKFHIDYQFRETFVRKSEYVLYVEYFILWDLQQGFERKNVLIYCMEDERIKEKAKEIWNLKQMEESETMDSIPLTQLLEQMAEDDSQVEGLITGTSNEEAPERPRLTPHEQLTKSFKVEQFLIDEKQENLLNRIKEWQIDYQRSISDEDSSVTTPELDPAQPTLKDHYIEEDRTVKDKSVQNRKEKNNVTESQHITVGDVNQSQTCSNRTKENLDETDQLLLQMGQDSIRKSGTDREPNTTKISDTSRIKSKNTKTNPTESGDKPDITTDVNSAVKIQSTNRIVQNTDKKSLEKSLNSDTEKPTNCERTSKNKIVCQSDEMGLKRQNLVTANVEVLKRNKIVNGDKNGDIASNSADSGPFNAFPGTQEFVPTKSPTGISIDDNNQDIVTSSQEVVSNNSVKSKSPVGPLDIQTQEFVPHCLSEDFLGSPVFGFSPGAPDSTSGNGNDTPPLFEDSYEKMETSTGTGKVNSQSESSEESIKFIALPIGKVTGKICSEKVKLSAVMDKILSSGDMPCSSSSGLSNDKIIEKCDREARLTLTCGGDGHHVDPSFKYDSLSVFEKNSERQKGKSKFEPDDDVILENDFRVKRRKLISAFEQQNCIAGDKNNNSNNGSRDTGNKKSDAYIGNIETNNADSINESDGNIDDIRIENVYSLNESGGNTDNSWTNNVDSLNKSDIGSNIDDSLTNNDISINESQGNLDDSQANNDDSINSNSSSTSTFRTVINKVLQIIGFTPKKTPPKSGVDQENISDGEPRQLSDDTQQTKSRSSISMDEQTKSSSIDSEELIVISSTSEENAQSEENLTLDSDSGQKETPDSPCSPALEDLPIPVQQNEQIQDSDITVSPDTSIDKEEVFTHLTEADTPTEIGQKLLDLKFPQHMMDEIGQYYLKM